MIHKNRKSGRGFYYFNNGDLYDGDWDDNLKSGKGSLICKKGDSCKGDWLQDDFVAGVYTDANGSKYKNLDHPDKPQNNGVFQKGRLYGYGRIDFQNGGTYEGMFKDGKRSGWGKMNYVMTGENDPRRETAEYVGEWRYNLRHGQGVMVWFSDSSRYEGLWHMDKRVQGTLKLGTTSRAGGAIEYTGEFRDDLFHGRGRMLLGDSLLGTTYEGVFEQGKCAKFGRLIYRDKSIYLGEM